MAGLTATAVPSSAAPPETAASTPAPAAGLGAATRVTLITGDTVSVVGGTRVTAVDRREGRSRTTYSVRSLGGHTYVVPDDAAPLVASGRLDRRLFDVTQLVADGYDDGHRRTLPLIVSYEGSTESAEGARRSLLSADVEVERRLPAVDGESLTAEKADAPDVWKALTRPAEGAVTTERGIDRVWLDGRVEATPSRDENPDPAQGTAQIHAPEAWKAGYDGKGVKVAVLDSGIDVTHPDVKGAVVGSKDFTGSRSTDDRAGHGTHVASTVVGSGVRSGGKYKGVAPGAKLLVGRVLDDRGRGQDSWLIAGMQWAAGQGAQVISMSLGGTDTPGVDPMEKAVGDLSASSGALFVIAAGNEGPQPGTVNTPGAASAALTVAAVDSEDGLADFSSVGPDASGELKPDISAPGVDIVGAKAAHGTQGDPAAPGYVRMSGTSMATPHVAGAAAILAQAHPDWSGQRLKAALMGSTVPLHGSSSPYAQGTGRVDVARALRQTVMAETPSLSFGLQRWPHTDDEPIGRTLTYRNTGSTPVTLDLSAAAGAPDGMFTVAPDRLTVPAGGTASATVTADTRVGTADGAFGGTITATAATGESVRTTVGAVREVESYDLTLKGIGRDGRATAPHRLSVVGLDTGTSWSFADDGTAPTSTSTTRVRVPKGRYLISAQLTNGTPDSPQLTQLVAPGLKVDRAMTLPLDARTGKLLKITAPDARARLTGGSLLFGARGAERAYDYAEYVGLGDNSEYRRVHLGQVGPAVPAGDFEAQVGGIWQRGTTGDLYDLAVTRKGTFFTGLNRTFTQRGLAKVVTSIGSNAKGSIATPSASWRTMGLSALADVNFDNRGEFWPVPAASVVHHVSTEGGLRWDLGAVLVTDDNPFLSVFETPVPRRYEPGRTYRDTFNTGVFGPVTSDSLTVGGPGAVRAGTAYAVCLPLLSDGAGHANYTDAKTRLRLTSGSTTVIDTRMAPCGFPLDGLLPRKADYRLSIDTSRPAGSVTVGARVSAVWTFSSAPTVGDKIERLPLSVVRFSPKLSLTSTAKAGTRLTVPIGIQGPAARKGAVKSLTVRVSYDGGRTWKPTTVRTDAHGKRSLALTHPARPTTVGLKATLVDRDGNTVTETMPTAYRTVR
ncbi:S8 family serine peptidase [Streptomyces sp. MB09-02B]|uniref:S8 family serine peptidase n=1 Tax=Streptomyces sp. MB09-02B TaxID=3028667 RepID=UPI0029AF57D5|nr:S8 family serine peptidase [Streptomyces sp. MB09-02B]MDX3642739.1 S8 family serine peptidase [Streptomyces sp. MB09-02B]